MIVESGCVEGGSGQKAQWYADALTTLRTWPEVVHYSYNDEAGGSLNDVNKNYRVDTSASSIQGYRAMGADPYVNPTLSYAELAAA